VTNGRRRARSRPASARHVRPIPSTRRAGHAHTAAEVFDVLWATLADVIGPTATAALLQRSVKRASADVPELRDLVIAREQFVYTYTVPASWAKTLVDPDGALAQMVRQLIPLLSELTGSVVVRRLQAEPVLGHSGVMPKDDNL